MREGGEALAMIIFFTTIVFIIGFAFGEVSGRKEQRVMEEKYECLARYRNEALRNIKGDCIKYFLEED